MGDSERNRNSAGHLCREQSCCWARAASGPTSVPWLSCSGTTPGHTTTHQSHDTPLNLLYSNSIMYTQPFLYSSSIIQKLYTQLNLYFLYSSSIIQKLYTPLSYKSCILNLYFLYSSSIIQKLYTPLKLYLVAHAEAMYYTLRLYVKLSMELTWILGLAMPASLLMSLRRWQSG